jgi:hypothetical protein
MLEAWMDEKYGKGVFFSKLHNYLSTHAYANAETSQLWDALKTPDQDVAAFMKTWTDQPGFPYLTFSQLSPDGFIVKQARFIFANLITIPKTGELSVDPKKQSWSIPVSFTVFSNVTGSPQRISRGFSEVSTLGNVELAFNQKMPSDFILLSNYLQTGVYRSLYEKKTYLYLIDWLKEDLEFLPAVERGGLFSDVFSMTFSGILDDPTICFDLASTLASETNVLVWNTALKDLESLKNVFALDELYGSIVEFQSSLIAKVIKNIGWVEANPDASNAHGRALLRGNLLQEAIRNNDGETVAIALTYFNQLKAGVVLDLRPEVYPAIYEAGVIYGDLDGYEFVLKKFRLSTFAPEQAVLLKALASSRTPYLQAKTLAFAIGGEVRNQDVQTVIKQVAILSPVGHISVWIFLMDNWDKMVSIFNGSGFSKFNDLLKEVTGSFTKSYLIKEAERLFVDQSDPDFEIPPGARIAVLKGLETSRQLLEWRAAYKEQVANWLEGHGFD